jgi:hypothetical protein
LVIIGRTLRGGKETLFGPSFGWCRWAVFGSRLQASLVPGRSLRIRAVRHTADQHEFKGPAPPTPRCRGCESTKPVRTRTPVIPRSTVTRSQKTTFKSWVIPRWRLQPGVRKTGSLGVQPQRPTLAAEAADRRATGLPTRRGNGVRRRPHVRAELASTWCQALARPGVMALQPGNLGVARGVNQTVATNFSTEELTQSAHLSAQRAQSS